MHGVILQYVVITRIKITSFTTQTDSGEEDGVNTCTPEPKRMILDLVLFVFVSFFLLSNYKLLQTSQKQENGKRNGQRTELDLLHLRRLFEERVKQLSLLRKNEANKAKVYPLRSISFNENLLHQLNLKDGLAKQETRKCATIEAQSELDQQTSLQNHISTAKPWEDSTLLRDKQVDFKKEAKRIDVGNVTAVYLLKSSQDEPIAVFKPTPFEGSASDLSQKLSTKREVMNEVTAYELNKSFVPKTELVLVPSHVVSNVDNVSPDQNASEKYIEGSVQEYINDTDNCEDYGPGVFNKDDVHKIGIVDLRILNCDRHSGNILMKKDTKALIPIDHALAFPEFEMGSSDDSTQLKLGDVSFDWMLYPQAKEQFSPETKAFIKAQNWGIDVEVMMRNGLTKSQIIAAVASSTLLKVGVLEFNKTLFEIGDMVQRKGNRENKSKLECYISRALELLGVSSVNKVTFDLFYNVFVNIVREELSL